MGQISSVVIRADKSNGSDMYACERVRACVRVYVVQVVDSQMKWRKR